MSEWLFEAAGEGGAASPVQHWDLATNTVRVGDRRAIIEADDPDFELLRSARDANGLAFPGTFHFSPKDGRALIPPSNDLSALSALPLKIDRSAHEFLAQEPQLVECPGEDVVFAGSPPLALLCDLPDGKLFRWARRREAWMSLPDIPRADGPESFRRAATGAVGFAYATAEHAVCIIQPGSDKWQRTSRSPGNSRIATPVVADGTGFAALAHVGASLAALKWSLADGWTVEKLSGDMPEEATELGPVTSAFGGLAGVCGRALFRVTPDSRIVLHELPNGFTPQEGLAPIVVGNDLYVAGSMPNDSPAWAHMSPNQGISETLPTSEVMTPFRDGFIGENGWTPKINTRAVGGPTFPPGIAVKPLVEFRDGILGLGIDAETLWPQALAMTRRRWRIQLILARSDGSIQDVTAKRRSDLLTRVNATIFGNKIAILGWEPGQALVWSVGSNAAASSS